MDVGQQVKPLRKVVGTETTLEINANEVRAILDHALENSLKAIGFEFDAIIESSSRLSLKEKDWARKHLRIGVVVESG